MRGRFARSGNTRDDHGNTPAYAGKTMHVVVLRVHAGEHPRVCGEDGRDRLMFLVLVGTPPRMRGRSIMGAQSNSEQGNTPAYAGKIQLRSPWFFLVRGTPPRMRGRYFATSVFASRNPVLASLRATTRTLQHACRASQAGVFSPNSRVRAPCDERM